MNSISFKQIIRRRTYLGLLIVLGGLTIPVLSGLHALADTSQIRLALSLGGMAAFATALGVLPMLFASEPGVRARTAMLGFGAGVMLAASCFSLLVPAIEHARTLGYSQWHASLAVGLAVLTGAAALMWLDRVLPHEHEIRPPLSIPAEHWRSVLLFVLAVILHNIPEGLAIGIAAAGVDFPHATTLATGIAIQDVPEGLVVGLALHSAGMNKKLAALIGAMSGVVEPVAAVFGALALSRSAALLPWGLAFAAGAMLLIVSHEVIPESHRHRKERYATGGLLLGFVLMLVLDTALS